MSVSKGQAEKDKGNAAFKAGDYPAAVGHYSAAIVADPTNATYPLNRAAAYLKLGKNEDVERDCERVLILDKKNVKAMFRRGQARVALQRLNEAKDDFQKALAIDSANDAVKAELRKVEEAIRAKGPPKQARQPADVAAPPLASASTASAPKPKRRRIPIEIVQSPTPSTSEVATGITGKSAEDMILKPVSTRPLSTSAPASSPLPASQANTFQEAKEARTAARSGVGGGIFRPNGKHTIFGEKNATSPPVTTSTTPSAPSPPRKSVPYVAAASEAKVNGRPNRPPMTLFEFSREWDKREIVEDRWILLNEVSPIALPSLFQSSLEARSLISIVGTLRDVLKAHPEQNVQERIREYMIGLTRVQRFNTVVMFMSSEERKVVKETWQSLGGGEGERAWGVS